MNARYLPDPTSLLCLALSGAFLSGCTEPDAVGVALPANGEDAGATEASTPEADAASDAPVRRDASPDAPVAAWVPVGSLGRGFDDSIYSISAVADIDRADRFVVVGAGRNLGASASNLRAVVVDGGSASLAVDLAPANGLSSLAFASGPQVLSYQQRAGSAPVAFHTIESGTWKSIALGSTGERPPQATFGSWPPRSIVATHTRRFFVGGSEIRDVTSLSASSWPLYAFNSGEAGHPTSAFEAAARDPANDDRVVLLSRIFNTIRTCTLATPLACTPEITTLGLPTADIDIDGFWPLGSEVYMSLRAPAGTNLYVSHDAGATFALSQSTFSGARYATAHAAHPSHFAWLDESSMHFTADAGRTWKMFPLPVPRRGLASGLALHAGASLYLFQEGNTYRYPTP